MLLKIWSYDALIFKIEDSFAGMIERKDHNRIKLLSFEDFLYFVVIVIHVVFMVKSRFAWLFLIFIDLFYLRWNRLNGFIALLWDLWSCCVYTGYFPVFAQRRVHVSVERTVCLAENEDVFAFG